MAAQATRGGGCGRQVFVCGDLHNLGDLKLLLQNLALVRGAGAVVRRWADLPQPVVRQVEAAGGQLVPGRAVLRFARRAFGAEVVLGGGQLVRDNVSLASLMGLLLAVISARLGGGRLVTRGLGVSAIRSPLRRLLWRAILTHCARVNLRDDASARNLADLLPGKARAVNADMVFLSCQGGGPVAPESRDRRWIIVAPCTDGSEGRSPEGAGLDAAVAAALREVPDAAIVIACHDPREHMDKAAASRLQARWPRYSTRVAAGYDLDALTALYADAALVVTNRLHSLVFAILAGAPVLAIEDGTAKVRAVADRFSVPVLDRHDAAGAPASVTRALDFDTAARGAVRREMAVRAAGNLV